MLSLLLSYTKKIRILAGCTCLVLILIGFRLYELQVYRTTNFLNLGQKNFLRVEKIQSPRGNILDAQGKLLATNLPITNLYWHGTGNRKLNTQQKNTLEALDLILGTEFASAPHEHGITSAEYRSRRLLLAHDISFEELSRIAEKFSDNANIQVRTTFKRHYPHSTLACHILGYLGNMEYDDSSGKMGLEKILEDKLKGQIGEVQKTINSLGKSLAEKELKQALAGSDIQTTLDLELQSIAETVFSEQYIGTFIIMDPKTGALRAVVSRPNFNPNSFLKSIDQQSWHGLQKDKAFLNRAFNACYPPASIFKLVTISAALEKEIVTPQAEVICKGFYKFGNYKHWCINHYGHGQLSVMQALAKSCNILFYHIGKHIGIDTLADYARRFGLGHRTNMLFPNQDGLVPTSEWKLTTKGERWWPGETLSAAIGQSFLLTTPIQLARMISGIFEGYLTTPRILEHEPIEKTPLAISKKTLRFLQESMRSVVQIGTGIRISKLKDIEVYAKTGTAQTSSLRLRQTNEKFMETGLFVGYFRYKEENPLTMIVLVERAGSSRIATNIGKEFLIAYRSLFEDQNPLEKLDKNSQTENTNIEAI